MIRVELTRTIRFQNDTILVDISQDRGTGVVGHTIGFSLYHHGLAHLFKEAGLYLVLFWLHCRGDSPVHFQKFGTQPIRFFAVLIRLAVGFNEFFCASPFLATMKERASSNHRNHGSEEERLKPRMDVKKSFHCVVPFHLDSFRSSYTAGVP